MYSIVSVVADSTGTLTHATTSWVSDENASISLASRVVASALVNARSAPPARATSVISASENASSTGKSIRDASSGASIWDACSVTRLRCVHPPSQGGGPSVGASLWSSASTVPPRAEPRNSQPHNTSTTEQSARVMAPVAACKHLTSAGDGNCADLS